MPNEAEGSLDKRTYGIESAAQVSPHKSGPYNLTKSEAGSTLPPGGNAEGLDPNVAALVNALTGANLGINYVDRESNHVKLTEFGRTEAEDPNEWLERYNRIAEANKWSEHRRFQIIGGYLMGAAVRWY